MTRSKKSNARKTRRHSRATAGAGRRVGRFIKALFASSLVSFGVGSWLLSTPGEHGAALRAVLADAGWPVQQATAPAAAPEGPYAATDFSQCRGFFPAGTPPIVPANREARELCFSAFAILHDGAAKTPVFVAQRLNRRVLAQTKYVERTDRFYAEARLPLNHRAELADYRGSGYSRGHMAPAADMPDDTAMAQSFSLANMVPQNQKHNGGPWSRVEQDTRKYVMRARGDVYIFTGPVYGDRPKTIGAGRVAVPSHLFKLVHDAETGRTWVHWHANSPDTKAGPPISYEEFTRRTGLFLLPQRQVSALK